MQIQFQLNPQMLVTVEGDTQRDLWESIARTQEVFGNSVCKKCGCTELQYVVRVDKDDNKYYELHCTNLSCRAKLSFGCYKKGGGLFPKRQGEDKEGNKTWLKNGGWLKWNKEKGCNE